MDPVNLYSLASRKGAWLAARQATVAANIANVSTPGYQAKDLAAFDEVLARTRLDLAATDARHLPVDGAGAAADAATQASDDLTEVTESGNTVGLEQEMIKAGDINREYALTTNVLKSFHAMLMASLRE